MAERRMVPMGKLLGLRWMVDVGARGVQLLQTPGVGKRTAVVSTSGAVQEWATVVEEERFRCR